MQIIVFIRGAHVHNGILTWIENFYERFKDRYSIKLLCETATKKYISIFEQIDQSKEYQCDVLLHNYEVNEAPANIKAARTYIVLHADYGPINKTFPFYKDMKYIAVSEVAASGVREKYGVDCQAIDAIMCSKPEKKKVYRFVSATRPTEDKGITRMEQLAKAMKDRGIIFEWKICYDPDWLSMHYRPIIPEMIIMHDVPHDTLLQYMADADYVVQLSEREGFCYAVHEALMMGTPVIVSDIPIFKWIMNGQNGYKLPLDMQDIPLDEILGNIPKPQYSSAPDTRAEKKWVDLIEGGDKNAQNHETEYNAY